jgi:aryl-alcohol dehydrogenase-like predicted oxidoreductase
MKIKNLGRTGLKVSELCLGCMTFGNEADEELSIRMIRRARDAGITFLDTANVYSRGRSEEIVGKALQGIRDTMVVATKVRGRTSSIASWSVSISRSAWTRASA